MDPSQVPAPKKKSQVWVILLVIFGVVVLFGVLAIGGAVWWFSANKDKFVAMAKEAEQQSTAFAAAGHDQNECVDEGLKRTDACDGLMCQAEAKVFTERCIVKAAPTAGFCDGAPPPTEIMNTVRYTQAQCEKHGHRADDQKCTQLMQAVEQACHPR